jgi:hypothetical protein
VVIIMKHLRSSFVLRSVASIAICSPLWAQEPSAPAPDKPAAPAPAPPKPGNGYQWQVGESTVKIGGYVKLDLIHDFDPIGSLNSFDPRTIPTDGSDGVDTRMQANQTRLNLDVRGPTSTDPLRFFVEGDFEGSSNAFRLRHAYGVMGPVLGGQTWTNFMDEDGMPETLDFESPIGFPQIRQAQARYTTKLESGNSFSFSVEDPAPKLVGVDTTTGRVEAAAPDVTANYIWKGSRGHLQLSGFGGVSSYNPDAGSTDSVPLWGVNLSTKLQTWGDDNTILQFTYGDGVGRYRGGVTAAPDANGNLEAITTTALLASYQHYWSEKYRSTLCYSWAHGDLPAGTPTDSPETLQYVAANLIWQFCDRAWTGVEYLYGTNDELDGSSGNATRLQFSLRFNL